MKGNFRDYLLGLVIVLSFAAVSTAQAGNWSKFQNVKYASQSQAQTKYHSKHHHHVKSQNLSQYQIHNRHHHSQYQKSISQSQNQNRIRYQRQGQSQYQIQNKYQGQYQRRAS